MEIILAKEDFDKTNKNDKKKSSQERYKYFLDKSQSLFNTINKQINYAISNGAMSTSFLVLPTCFTVEVFEKILKYHLEKIGYSVETEIVFPKAYKIEKNINTTAIAISISWENISKSEESVC